MTSVERAVKYVQKQFKQRMKDNAQIAITIVEAPFENMVQEDDVDAVTKELEKLGYVVNGPHLTIYNEKYILIEKKL